MRRLLKIVAFSILTLAVLVMGLYLYVFKFDGLESIVNDRLMPKLQARYGLDIKVGKIHGGLWEGITLENVAVFYQDSTYRYEMAYLPRLTTSLAFPDIWNMNFVLDYLNIDSARIRIQQDSAGHWLLPWSRATSSSGESSVSIVPPIAIQNFGLKHANITLVRQHDTLSLEDIMVALAFRVEFGTVSVDVDQFEFTSNQKRLSLSSAGGKLTYAQRRLVFRDVSLISLNTRAKLDGTIAFAEQPTGMLTFSVDHLDLAELTQYVGPKLSGVLDVNGNINFVGTKLQGSIDLGGTFLFMGLENLYVDFRYADQVIQIDTVIGTVFGDCSVDGSGIVDLSSKPEVYTLEADVRQFNLDHLLTNTFQSNLNGHLVLNGRSFRSKEMRLHTNVDLYESSFDDYPIQRAKGDLIITTDSIWFLDSFRVDYFENSIYAKGRVTYHGDMDLKLSLQLNNLDRWKGKLFIDQPGGRGYAEASLTGATKDPDLAGYFKSDSVWIYGLYSDSAYATMDIKRFLTGKQGYVRANFYNGTAWDTPYDSGYTYLRIDSNLVMIDTARIRNQFVRARGTGELNYATVPMKLTLDTMDLNLFDQRFYNQSAIQMGIDSLGFDFLQASIAGDGAGLTVNGRTNYDESMNLSFSLHNVKVGPWQNLFIDSVIVDGVLSGEGELKGSFHHPEFTVNAQVDSMTYSGLYLGSMQTFLRYKDSLLHIDSLIVHSDSGSYRAHGYMHADLALTTDSIERFPNLPMQIEISASDSRFDLVELFLPSVQQLTGKLFADFTLSGTPKEPHLEGEAYVKNADLKYFDIENHIYSDSAGISMRDNRIIINGISTYVLDPKKKNKKKYANIRGTITVRSLSMLFYDLKVDIPEEMPFTYALEDARGSFKGKFNITGESPPTVTGSITLYSLDYRSNFAEPGAGSPIMTSLIGESTWNLDIDVDIPSNFTIQNEDIDAQFSGDINVTRQAGNYSFIGELDIVRGKGYLWDKVFTMDPGGTATFTGGDSLNPALNITAYTYVPVARYTTDATVPKTERLRLAIQITGTLDEPQINPTQDSDVGSVSEILPLLVTNTYSTDSTQTTGGFENRIAGYLSTQVSQIGSRQLSQLSRGYVQTFEISPSYTNGTYDPLQSQLTVGFYTVQNLYTYVSSGFTGQTGTQVGFEYRLNKSFLIEGLLDEQQLYHLSLKLHVEY